MTGRAGLSGRRVEFVVGLASQFETGVAHRGNMLEGEMDGGGQGQMDEAWEYVAAWTGTVGLGLSRES